MVDRREEMKGEKLRRGLGGGEKKRKREGYDERWSGG